MKKGILFANAGRRATLIKDFKKSIGEHVNIFATDNWCVAPSLFFADSYFLTKKIYDKDYIDELLDICVKNNIKAVTTCIDPEIEILSSNRERFEKEGIQVFCPSKETAKLCFDKYEMYLYLISKGIKTPKTFANIEDFLVSFHNKEIEFPVFVKPRTGSGSLGISKINNIDELKEKLNDNKYKYIIQEFMDCEDCDADVYIDYYSNEVISIFAKKKIETRIGGASKTISFKDDNLFEFIKRINEVFKFYGPIDMDFFIKNGEYYLNEINPRFGGAYLHAYGSGVDFPKYMLNNILGKTNNSEIGNYEKNTIMLMYDEVVITHLDELKGDYND